MSPGFYNECMKYRGGLIFPTSQISDAISVGKMIHFLSRFSDILFCRHLIFPTVFPMLQNTRIIGLLQLIHILNPELLENQLYEHGCTNRIVISFVYDVHVHKHKLNFRKWLRHIMLNTLRSYIKKVIKDICPNAHLKTLTHLYKITSIHLKIRKKKLVK